MVPVFKLGLCFSVTMHIVNLWQYNVCCIWSGVTRCTLLMVIYPFRMHQCRLHAVHWSHIGILMRLLSAPPYLFYISICWHCGPRVFGLVGWKSLAPSLLLPTFFNNYNNNNNKTFFKNFSQDDSRDLYTEGANKYMNMYLYIY